MPAFCQCIFTIILTLRLFQIWPVEVSVQADFSVLLVLSSFWGEIFTTLHCTGLLLVVVAGVSIAER